MFIAQVLAQRSFLGLMSGTFGVTRSMTGRGRIRRVRTEEEIKSRESTLVIRRRSGLVLGITRGNAGRG